MVAPRAMGVARAVERDVMRAKSDCFGKSLIYSSIYSLVVMVDFALRFLIGLFGQEH